MAAVGGNPVILALLSIPRMTIRAYISVLPAVLRQRMCDDAYRVYVTDCLRIIGENTARHGGGGYMKIRYAEIISDKPQETRTSTEIIDGVKSRLRQIGGET